MIAYLIATIFESELINLSASAIKNWLTGINRKHLNRLVNH